MSDKPGKGAQSAAQSKEPREAGHSNKTKVLVAGAAVAALLLGGGYYAWTQSNNDPSQVASSDDAALYAAPATDNAASINDATTQKAVTAESADAPALAAPETKKGRVAAAKVPEETIGVSRASAQTNTADALVINGRRPVWRYTPRAERLAEYYPSYALERGREGEARLHCMIGQRGKLDCERVSESPARAGFGAAAIKVAHSFRHADRRADGSNAIGTPINLRVLFRVEEERRRRG